MYSAPFIGSVASLAGASEYDDSFLRKGDCIFASDIFSLLVGLRVGDD